MKYNNVSEIYRQLVLKLEERSRLGGVIATMHWDQEVIMPKGAAENRSKQMATLAGILHEKTVDIELGRIIKELINSDMDIFTEIERCNIHEAEREYKIETKVPKELVKK